MKRSFWKKIAVSICSALFAVAAFFGVIVALPASVTTSAEEEATWQTGTFEMEDGASLRLSEANGLRFIVKMDETVYRFVADNEDVELGFVIAPKQLIEAANGDYLGMSKKTGGKVDKAKIYQQEGSSFYYANGCIYKIKYNSYTYDFMAVAYIKQGDTVRYTEYNDYARNNLYDTVNMAVLGGYAETVLGYDTYNGWYGSEVFPIMVESTEEYNEVVSLVNDDKLDLSDRYVTVTEEVSTSQEFTDATLQPTVLSQGLDELNKLIDGLPNVGDFEMPNGIGMIARIREAEKKYNALSADDRAQVENPDKLQGLIAAIEGYDRVYVNGANDGTVIASTVPNYTSTVGGTASTRQDDVYGNVLTVQSSADGKAQLYIQGFPSVTAYEKVYFYIRSINAQEDSGGGCNVYWSDGIANDGKGVNEKNNWLNAFWTNDSYWRLVELNVADGYIGTEFAIGLRTPKTGFTFEISDFYGLLEEREESGLTFGTRTDNNETHEEYGKIYDVSQEQYHVDNNQNSTLAAFVTDKLYNALPDGFEYFYFYLYNPVETEQTFHLAGSVGNDWVDSKDYISLAAQSWTKIVISAEDIAYNRNGQWYLYLYSGTASTGGTANVEGWKISTIYAGPDYATENGYTDYADVKAVIEQIAALPESPTEDNRSAVEAARAAYDALTAMQQAQVSNLSKLTAAENYLADVAAAKEVIALIDAINARDLDEALVTEARTAYNALSATQQSYVTNIAVLEEYEAQIKEEKDLAAAVSSVNTLIANLPDSVTMPDHLVFVSRIEAARDEYAALSEEGKGMVENYAKLRSLLSMIKGYETVQRMSVDCVDIVANYHVAGGYTSTGSGTLSMGYDGYYGNYLTVTSDANSTVGIQFKNFPDVSKYAYVYFNIRATSVWVSESEPGCNVYISDGTTNDGWGDNWHNNWYLDNYWINEGNWGQLKVAVNTQMLSSNFALMLRTKNVGVTFQITDFVGYSALRPNNLTFGIPTDITGKNANEYGIIKNFEKGWTTDKDNELGGFNVGALKGGLPEGHDSYRFYFYNPTETDIVLSFMTNDNNWTHYNHTALQAKAWTELTITSDLVVLNETYFLSVMVEDGKASTEGWQISGMYTYSSVVASADSVGKVEELIKALDASSPDEAAVTAAREAYEALNEKEKALVDASNLIACEEALYANATLNEFIANATTKYKLYYESNKEAVTFVQEQLKAVTDVTVTLDKNEPTTLTKYSYAIVFGYSSLWANLEVELPTLENGSGYAIKKVGRAVLVYATSEDGYRMAALAFLRETIGYEMISEDCVIYTGDPATLPEIDLVEAPDFEFRQQQTYMTEDELYGMGLQAHNDIWIASNEGWDMHNTTQYLPTATYQNAHPSWYYTDSGNIVQVCPTAGGSSTEFNAMVEAIASGLLTQINANPTKKNISFSIMDTTSNSGCSCTRCQLYNTLYGEGGFAAAWIDLMNAVNAKVREGLTAEREVNLAFLAYRGTEKAPANDDFSLMKRYEIADNGSYTQTDEYLKCDEGVTVWLAPINALYAENFNHADNAEQLATVKKWCALSSSVYLWMYGANFKYYMYPYNTWQASAENYKLFKELGVKAVWSQSNETEGTAFSDLKGYIDSKFMFDVSVDYEAVLDSYFTNYFGVAAEKMRSMFDQIVAKCNEIEENYDGLGRGIYDEIENTSGFIGIGANTYWSKDWIDGLVTLCDEAKALVDADTSLTDEEKTAIKNRITKESLFPRYVLCTTFASKYSTANKKTMRQAFKADCEALGITRYREADGVLSDLYSDWGV